MPPQRSNATRPVVNHYRNPRLGRRTGQDVRAGKNIRKGGDGLEIFDDYITDIEDSTVSDVCQSTSKLPRTTPLKTRRMSSFEPVVDSSSDNESPSVPVTERNFRDTLLKKKLNVSQRLDHNGGDSERSRRLTSTPIAIVSFANSKDNAAGDVSKGKTIVDENDSTREELDVIIPQSKIIFSLRQFEKSVNPFSKSFEDQRLSEKKTKTKRQEKTTKPRHSQTLLRDDIERISELEWLDGHAVVEDNENEDQELQNILSPIAVADQENSRKNTSGGTNLKKRKSTTRIITPAKRGKTNSNRDKSSQPKESSPELAEISSSTAEIEEENLTTDKHGNKSGKKRKSREKTSTPRKIQKKNNELASRIKSSQRRSIDIDNQDNSRMFSDNADRNFQKNGSDYSDGDVSGMLNDCEMEEYAKLAKKSSVSPKKLSDVQRNKENVPALRKSSVSPRKLTGKQRTEKNSPVARKSSVSPKKLSDNQRNKENVHDMRKGSISPRKLTGKQRTEKNSPVARKSSVSPKQRTNNQRNKEYNPDLRKSSVSPKKQTGKQRTKKNIPDERKSSVSPKKRTGNQRNKENVPDVRKSSVSPKKLTTRQRTKKNIPDARQIVSPGNKQETSKRKPPKKKTVTSTHKPRIVTTKKTIQKPDKRNSAAKSNSTSKFSLPSTSSSNVPNVDEARRKLSFRIDSSPSNSEDIAQNDELNDEPTDEPTPESNTKKKEKREKKNKKKTPPKKPTKQRQKSIEKSPSQSKENIPISNRADLWKTLREAPVLIKPDENNNNDGLRRSNRIRVKPLEIWRNERLTYDGKGMERVVTGISSPAPDLAPIFNKLFVTKKHKNAKRTEKIHNEHSSLEVPLEDMVEVPAQPLLVINAETDENVYIVADLVGKVASRNFQGPDGNEATGDDPYIVCLVTCQKLFRQGHIILRPQAEKPLHCVEDSTLLFYVAKGKLLVTIHCTSFVAETGDSFFVPIGNKYNLKNLKIEKETHLAFTQLLST